MITSEWLNDAQVANILALLLLPTSRRIVFNYPRGHNAHTLFQSKRVQAALNHTISPPLAGVVQNYVADAHWRKLIVSFEESRVYYFEPFGGRLSERRNAELLRSFELNLKATDDAWELESIDIKLQSDGSSCGVWIVLVDKAYIDYCDSATFGSGGFKAFLVEWLAERGISDLGRDGSRTTVKSNMDYILEERGRLREELRSAAEDGALSWADGPMLDVFVREGEKEPTVEELEALEVD